MHGLLAQPLKRKAKNLIFSPFQLISLSTWQPNQHRAGRPVWHHDSKEQARRGLPLPGGEVLGGVSGGGTATPMGLGVEGAPSVVRGASLMGA